jgi:hypothetical protein
MRYGVGLFSGVKRLFKSCGSLIISGEELFCCGEIHFNSGEELLKD